MEHECDGDTNCNWYSQYSHQRFGTRKGGNKRTSGDHPKHSIVVIDWNTEKSPGNRKRLAVTQTPMQNHQLTLVRKILQRIMIIIIIITIIISPTTGHGEPGHMQGGRTS